MLLRLVALFVTVPLIELYLLLQVGKVVGLPATLVLVIGTGVLGAWLTRRQGLKVLAEFRSQMDQGQLPAGPLIEGLLVLVAGAVLLTPGLLTDACGFALLLPGVRRRIRDMVRRRLSGRFPTVAVGGVRPTVVDPDAIDVEWSEE